MGRSAYFLRTFGCPVHCPWCDSAGTWHPEHIPRHIQRMTVEEIVIEVCEEPVVDFVVITGGEPAVHNLQPLCDALVGLTQIHLETSGAFKLHGRFHHITLSPKRWKMPLVEVVQQADEFKLIIEKPEDIWFYTKFLKECFAPSGITPPVWLHPEWSQRENVEVLKAISTAVVQKLWDVPFRAGWQLHKMYQVDKFDKRSRPPVPLGGDTTKGY